MVWYLIYIFKLRIMTKTTKNITLTGASIVGALGGYLYWYYVGCQSGSCPITSKWYMSVLWGGLLGYFVGDILVTAIKNKKEQDTK